MQSRNEKTYAVEKYASDRADGILVFTIISIPFFVLVMTFIINTAQMAMDKQELTSLVQRSAQAAVSQVNGYGSLNKNSILASVQQIYAEEQFVNGNIVGGFKTARHESTIGNGDNITTKFCEADIRKIDAVDDAGVLLPTDKQPILAKDAPYVFVYTLSKERGIGVNKGNTAGHQNFTGASEPISFIGPFTASTLNDMRKLNVNPNDRLQVVNIKAYINMRSAWAPPGTESCRTQLVDVSATTFGSSKDVDYGEDFDSGTYNQPGWENQESQWGDE